MPTPREILVLGGGVGGTVVANLLVRELGRRQAHVTVIDRTGRHVYQPGWLYVPFGGPPPKRWERPERALLSRKVDLVVGEAQRIDRAGHVVQMADGTRYPYDDLVIATGAHLAPETIPGYAEAAHHFYSPEAAVRLRDALEGFQGGKVLIGVADIPYKCPPAPLEFTFLLDEYLRKRGIRERTEITYLSPINRVFTIESVSTFVTPLLEERGIQHEEFFNTESIDPVAKTVTSMEGTELGFDLLVLGLVERQQVVLAGSEDRCVGCQRLPLAIVDGADVDGESEVRPGRLHLAVREEQARHNPGLLLGQGCTAGHVLPLAESGEEHRGARQADGRRVIRVYAGFTDRVHPARAVLSNDAR